VKETEENERKLAKMIEDGKDPYDIKKFKEVLGESQMMIPDSQNRHKKSLDELKEFMSLHEEELEDNEWLMSAKTLVEEAA
jgi:tubulin-specific chaperone A